VKALTLLHEICVDPGGLHEATAFLRETTHLQFSRMSARDPTLVLPETFTTLCAMLDSGSSSDQGGISSRQGGYGLLMTSKRSDSPRAFKISLAFETDGTAMIASNARVKVEVDVKVKVEEGLDSMDEARDLIPQMNDGGDRGDGGDGSDEDGGGQSLDALFHISGALSVTKNSRTGDSNIRDMMRSVLDAAQASDAFASHFFEFCLDKSVATPEGAIFWGNIVQSHLMQFLLWRVVSLHATRLIKKIKATFPVSWEFIDNSTHRSLLDPRSRKQFPPVLSLIRMATSDMLAIANGMKGGTISWHANDLAVLDAFLDPKSGSAIAWLSPRWGDYSSPLALAAPRETSISKWKKTHAAEKRPRVVEFSMTPPPERKGGRGKPEKTNQKARKNNGGGDGELVVTAPSEDKLVWADNDPNFNWTHSAQMDGEVGMGLLDAARSSLENVFKSLRIRNAHQRADDGSGSGGGGDGDVEMGDDDLSSPGTHSADSAPVFFPVQRLADALPVHIIICKGVTLTPTPVAQ
jgi:hypothetical protein